MNLATWNARGFVAPQHDVALFVSEHKCDLLILTETKLSAAQQYERRKQHPLNATHKFFFSSTPSEARRRGSVPTHLDAMPVLRANSSAGVAAILVPALAAMTVKVDAPVVLAGHILHLRVALPSATLHVLGVYMPANNTALARVVQAYIVETCQAAANAMEHALVLGDFNATLHDSDRAGGVAAPQDTRWRNTVQQALLGAPPDHEHTAGAPRLRSFFGSNGVAYSARIDDILASPGLLPHCVDTLVVADPSLDVHHVSDHHPVVGGIWLERLGTPVPPPVASPERPLSFKFPISAKAKEDYKEAATAALAPQIAQLATDTAPALAAALAKQLDAAGVNLLGTKLEPVIADLLAVAVKHVPTSSSPAAALKAQGNFLPRSMAIKHRALKSTVSWGKALLQATRPSDVAPRLPANSSLQRLRLEDQHAWMSRVLTCVRDARAALTSLTREHNRNRQRKRSARAARMLLTQRARLYRETHHAEPVELTAIFHEGKLVTNPPEFLDLLADKYAESMQPLRPVDPAEPPPWDPNHPAQRDPATRLDPYELESPGAAPVPTVPVAPGAPPAPPPPPPAPAPLGVDLLGSNEAIIQILRSRQNGTAPGPDRIPYELLKEAPEELLEVIADIFRICYLVGCVPQSWKHSTTTLLYKNNGSPTDPNNFRPIGLLRTIYKWFSGTVDAVCRAVAEPGGLLSEAQEGFRPKRNCHRQIHMLHGAISDARLHNKALHVAFIDFRAAFSSISHARFREVLEQQRIPEDVIRIILNMYTDATTSVITPLGTTRPVPYVTGTIIGDILSPGLFNIFVNGLLLWLQQGRVGYSPGCLKALIAALCFADDVALLAMSKEDLRIQLEKIDRFCA